MRENIRGEWEKWKTLDAAGKRSYFLDYYLLPVGIVCAVIFIAVLVLQGILFPGPETELTVAIFDVTLDAEAEEETVAYLAGQFGIDSSQILLDDSYRSDSSKDIERLQVLVANQSLDVLIANDEITKVLAGYGYFRDVTTLLSESETELLEQEGKLLVTAGYQEGDEVSFEDNETAQGEALPYAVFLDESSRWKSLTEYYGEYRDFSILVEDKYPEHAVAFLRYLLEK